MPGSGNVTVNLKLFLHGYYDNNGLMQKVLYNQSVVSDPASVLADSVTVELHAATYPYSMVKTTTALLHFNGTLTRTFLTIFEKYLSILWVEQSSFLNA